MTVNKRNASVKPAAIFLPKVHMRLLLLLSTLFRGRAFPAATARDHFHDQRNVDDCENLVCRVRYLFDMPANGILLTGCKYLGRRDSQITFQITERQANPIFVTTQRQPPALIWLTRVAEKRRQTVDGNQSASDTSDPEQFRNPAGQGDDLVVVGKATDFPDSQGVGIAGHSNNQQVFGLFDARRGGRKGVRAVKCIPKAGGYIVKG